MNKASLFLLAMALLSTALPARAEVRYAPPTPGRLMLNEVVATDRPSQYTLYLDKPGRFYAEVIFEGEHCAVSGPTLEFSLFRGKKLQWTRQVALRLDDQTPHQTLFWLHAPDDVPYRTALGLILTPAAGAPAACPLRLQITRKFDILPVVPR